MVSEKKIDTLLYPKLLKNNFPISIIKIKSNASRSYPFKNWKICKKKTNYNRNCLIPSGLHRNLDKSRYMFDTIHIGSL